MTPMDAVPAIDPLPVLKGLASLRKLTGMYPRGHPAIAERLAELEAFVQRHLAPTDMLRIDVIHGDAHLDGLSFRQERDTNARVIQELTDLGIDSIHIARGIDGAELLALAELLWDLRSSSSPAPMAEQLARRGIRHVSLAKLVPLDTRWPAGRWPTLRSRSTTPPPRNRST